MVQVSVFSEKGDLIYTREQQIQDFSRKTNIDLSRQITGTYIVVMDGPTVRKTFKIVKKMKNQILKYFSFIFTLILLSCGGGGGDDGGGGGGGPVDPPPTPPGKSTLVAPANNKTCETGTSVSDTQSTVAFSWNASASTNTYDVRSLI